MESSPRFRSRARVPHPPGSSSSRCGARRRAGPGAALAGLGTVWALACVGLVAMAAAGEPVRERPLRALAIGIGEDYASNRRTADAARRTLTPADAPGCRC